MKDAGLKLIVAIIVLAVIVGSVLFQYNCCRNAGFTRDQCIYSVACEGG